MDFSKKLGKVKRTFVGWIIGLVMASVLSIGLTLYVTNAIELRRHIASGELTNLTADYPEVQSYIQTHKNIEPHFISVANIVKEDQQALLGKAFLLTGIPILILSTALAYLLARKLVRPVEETFIAQERFLQDASHEMRNPLAAILAVIQEGRNNAKTKADTKTFDTLERQTQQLVKLNEDLLLLERSKTSHVNASNHNLSNLLLDVTDSEYAKASLRKIVIKTSVAPGITGYINDKDWICMAQNIISNAVKYSNPGGKITVRLRQDKQIVTFEVTDQGIGIPESEISNIGQRFYRASNVNRTPGTGLGLAIVSQIVSTYKGILIVKNNQKKGTHITIKLPIARA